MTTTFEPAKDNLAPPLPWLHPAVEPGPEADSETSAELVLVFASTTEVLNAEDRLEAGNFKFSLIPVPKEVNPNCGLALSIPEESAPDIARSLAEAGLAPRAVYRRQDGEFLPVE